MVETNNLHYSTGSRADEETSDYFRHDHCHRTCSHVPAVRQSSRRRADRPALRHRRPVLRKNRQPYETRIASPLPTSEYFRFIGSAHWPTLHGERPVAIVTTRIAMKSKFASRLNLGAFITTIRELRCRKVSALYIQVHINTDAPWTLQPFRLLSL